MNIPLLVTQSSKSFLIIQGEPGSLLKTDDSVVPVSFSDLDSFVTAGIVGFRRNGLTYIVSETPLKSTNPKTLSYDATNKLLLQNGLSFNTEPSKKINWLGLVTAFAAGAVTAGYNEGDNSD